MGLAYDVLRSRLEANTADLRAGVIDVTAWCDRVHALLALERPDTLQDRRARREHSTAPALEHRMSTLLDTRAFEVDRSPARATARVTETGVW